MTISSAQKLSIYNGALTFIGERALSALIDSIESRRLLDVIWDRGGINEVLEKGQWKFATRPSAITYNSSITPAYGYGYVFDKPSDFVRLCAMCSDEYYITPLLAYMEAGGFWFSNVDTIYVKYVSNDGSYGTDYSLWPAGFKKCVESYFGSEIVGKLTQSETKEDAKKKEFKRMLTESQSLDAMAGPTVFPPPGSFRTSRHTSRISNE